jgi:23S rRNA pseudouridine1911/1915/1917 synthase
MLKEVTLGIILCCLYQLISAFHLLKAQQRILSTSRLSNAQEWELIADDKAFFKVRLDAFLASQNNEFSRSYFGSLCEQGLVLVNGKLQGKSYKINKNDQIKVSLISKQTTSVEPENIPLDILYEDEHILAINKPNGMVVHPAVGSPNGTFVNALLFHLRSRAEEWFQRSNPSVSQDQVEDPSKESKLNHVNEKEENDFDQEKEDEEDDEIEEDIASFSPLITLSSSSASLRPGIVHRLDKGTTGVLLAAKHPAALDQLSQIFTQRKITKIYLAICLGHPGETTILEPIARSITHRQLMCVDTTGSARSKPAITHVKTLCFDGKLSVVLVRIETGR